MAGSSSNQGDIFDVKRIRRLVELMNEHELSEIDLRQSDQRIRLRKGFEPVVTNSPQRAAAGNPAPSGGSAEALAANAQAEANLVLIKSPMIGTHYTSPSPDAPPFVKVGDHVDPTTTVCVIEAMKVFNEIPAETSGQIVAVLVDNGEPVEFGQPLFKVDPHK
ncbi:MAG: acetyl-CoA carboxylase biotin carboxyl carrier protein [Pirellulales bacterium]